MSTRPTRRPLPRAIYWRRRFLLLAVVLLVVWLVVRLWPGGSDDSRPAAAPSPSASASGSATASPTPSPTPSRSAQSDAQVTLTATSTACTPESVRMTPTVPEDQSARQAVRVELLISTTAKKGCTLDPGDTDLIAVIKSGDTAVWDSTVCKTALLDEPVALSPGWATAASARWSGRGSGPACSPREGWASPGTYTLRIGTLGGEPGATTFKLVQPKPKPKPSPSPTPSASASAKPSAKPSASASPTPRASPSRD